MRRDAPGAVEGRIERMAADAQGTGKGSDKSTGDSTGKAAAQKSVPQKAMEKMGLRRDIDLALHLPLRYEDETRIAPIGELRHGDTAQCEGVVRDTRVELRPRRHLITR